MKKKKNSAPMATMPGKQNNNSVPNKVARAGKWVVVAVGGIAFFLGCEKEPKTPVTPVDPNKAKIEKLMRDSTRLEKEFNAAIEPAKYVDQDISTYFGLKYNEVVADEGEPTNLRGRADVHSKVVKRARLEVGEVLPVNNPTMTNLEVKSDSLVYVIDELQRIRTLKAMARAK